MSYQVFLNTGLTCTASVPHRNKAHALCAHPQDIVHSGTARELRPYSGSPESQADKASCFHQTLAGPPATDASA